LNPSDKKNKNKLSSKEDHIDKEQEGYDDFQAEDNLFRTARFKKESLSPSEKRLLFRRIIDHHK